MIAKKFGFLIGAALLVAGGAILVRQHQALSALREQNQALRLRVTQLTEQAQARQSQPEMGGQTPQLTAPREDPLHELERLRGEAGANPPAEELAKLRAQNRRLRAATDEPADPVEAEFKKETIERVNNLKVCGLDFHMYASRNKGQFPESWEQAFREGQKRSSTKDPAALEAYMNNLTNHFEIVYQGQMSAIPKPGETIVFREKQARLSPKGEWVKVYGYADGSVQIHAQADENFAAWEQQHLFGAK